MTLSPQIQGSFTPTLFFTIGDTPVGSINVTHHSEPDINSAPVSRSWARYHRVGNIVNGCFCLDFTINSWNLAGNAAASCVLNMGGFPADIAPGVFIDDGTGNFVHDGTTDGTGIGSSFFSPGDGAIIPNFNADMGLMSIVVAPTIGAVRWQGIISDGALESPLLLKASQLAVSSRYYMRGNFTYWSDKPVA